MNKRSQMMSFDLTAAFVIFVIIISLLVSYIVFSDVFERQKSYDYELDYIFQNMEKNIKTLPDDSDFLDGSRVDYLKLIAFAENYKNSPVDDMIIGHVPGQTQGIGLDTEGYDVCLYFTDNAGAPLNIQSNPLIHYIGETKKGRCEEVIFEDDENPCEGYSDAVSLLKPVLLDSGGPAANRIIQMNVVVCVI